MDVRIEFHQITTIVWTCFLLWFRSNNLIQFLNGYNKLRKHYVSLLVNVQLLNTLVVLIYLSLLQQGGEKADNPVAPALLTDVPITSASMSALVFHFQHYILLKVVVVKLIATKFPRLKQWAISCCFCPPVCAEKKNCFRHLSYLSEWWGILDYTSHMLSENKDK